MIFYKVILYGVNFVLPHSMSAKSKIKFLVFTAASPKGLQLLTFVWALPSAPVKTPGFQDVYGALFIIIKTGNNPSWELSITRGLDM